MEPVHPAVSISEGISWTLWDATFSSWLNASHLTMISNLTSSKPSFKMPLLAAFVLFLLVGRTPKTSALTNRTSNNPKNIPQPPPFSPSLERLIHKDLESHSSFTKVNVSSKSLNEEENHIRGNPNPQNEAPHLHHTLSQQKTFVPSASEKSDRPPESVLFGNRFLESGALRGDSVTENSDSTRAGDGKSNTRSSGSQDNPATERSLADFDNPFDSDQEDCPPSLELGHTRWRRGSNVVTVSLPYLVRQFFRLLFSLVNYSLCFVLAHVYIYIYDSILVILIW